MKKTDSTIRVISSHGRCYTSSKQYRKIPNLPDVSVKTFRQHAFLPAQPFVLQSDHLNGLPAIHKWFKQPEKVASEKSPFLNVKYLERYGSTIVPVECISQTASDEEFTVLHCPLSDFLHLMSCHGESQTARLYIAQCPISSLPADLQNDLPTPSVVKEAGKGDIYDSSIWLGLAPTYTPLHKDPNPNLFVQLAGTKRVRIFEPRFGAEIFAEAQRRIGRVASSAAFRGEEMMQGEEKRMLERLVWGDGELGGCGEVLGGEAWLQAGEGMFIPKGWWHSIKGIGDGIVGSVNWWFR